MKDLAPVMGDEYQHIQFSEGDRGNVQEVDGDNVLGVVSQKCAPVLRWGLRWFDRVFLDGGFTNGVPEFLEFAFDAWRSPCRIFK